MKKYQSRFKNFTYLCYRWLVPQGGVISFSKSFPRYLTYFSDLRKYSKMKGSEKIKLVDTYPCLHDKTKKTSFDSHYFYQDIWCAKKIFSSKTPHHVDVGSLHTFIGFLTTFTKITFVDIRPLEASLKNFESKKGSILSLPFDDNSIQSISCLHVAEHIGLGRYGDPLDPFGTQKAARELIRVLAPGGNLYFSLPVGKPRICFNAHRIHLPEKILEYFNQLNLIEFSGIDDHTNFRENIDLSDLKDCDYACGLFWFTKRK